MSGYLYVLYDGFSGLCKIGCTKSNGQRQKKITAGHGSVLVNVLNVKIDDHYSAESKCHNQFKDFRTNGEWFNVDIVSVIEFIHAEIDWLEIDFINLSRLIRYHIACKQRDYAAARDAILN